MLLSNWFLATAYVHFQKLYYSWRCVLCRFEWSTPKFDKINEIYVSSFCRTKKTSKLSHWSDGNSSVCKSIKIHGCIDSIFIKLEADSTFYTLLTKMFLEMCVSNQSFIFTAWSVKYSILYSNWCQSIDMSGEADRLYFRHSTSNNIGSKHSTHFHC